MKVALAADHAGYPLKERLVEELRGSGHEVLDFGTEAEASCDYPDFAIPAARSVAAGDCDRAVLVCTNGIGMAMVANRIPGVRGALVYSERTAEMTRRHHDSNVLCLGGKEFAWDDLLKWVRVWLSTDFEGGRHARRVSKFPGHEAN